MNKISRMQPGSAVIVVIIVLAVVIMGALGFVFWQNFLQPKASQQTQTAVQEDGKKTAEQIQGGSYKSTAYSFNYPEEGWRLEETEDSITDSGIVTPTLYTSDYAQQGMGLDAGAMIGVYVASTENTIDEEYTHTEGSVATFGLEELKKTTINGQTAITYHSDYEGPHYHTIFIKDGKLYDIVYQYAYMGSAQTHINAYERVTSTFKLN